MTTEDERGALDVVSYVIRHMRCEACSESYGPGDVHVTWHDPRQSTLAAVCPVCQTERLVRVYNRPPYEQLRHGINCSDITQDEVRGWASFLETFTGDCADLIESGL